MVLGCACFKRAVSPAETNLQLIALATWPLCQSSCLPLQCDRKNFLCYTGHLLSIKPLLKKQKLDYHLFSMFKRKKDRNLEKFHNEKVLFIVSINVPIFLLGAHIT